MPSKKLPNRVEGLFDSTRSIVKDGRAAVATLAAPRRLEPGVVTPSDFGLPQSLSGWSWETDASGAYLFCSAEVETLLGFSPRELQGKHLTSLAGAGNGNIQALKDALASARPFTDLRLQVQRRDGQMVTLVITGHPIRDEAGTLTGYHGITYLALPQTTRVELPAAVVPSAAGLTLPTAEAALPAAEAALPAAEAALPAAEAAPLPVTVVPPQPAALTLAAAPAPSPAPAPETMAPPRPPAPQVTLEPAAEPALPPSQPAHRQAWGYVEGPDGMAPVEPITAPLPDIDEAIRWGQLVQKAEEAPAAGGEPPHALRSLAAPIKLQNQILGALNFFDLDNAQAWSEDDVALAQTVADQLALALENARLFNETRTQQRNATYLARATQAVARTLGERELWNVLADELFVTYHPTRIVITHWDSLASTLTPLALRGETETLELGMPGFLGEEAADVLGLLESQEGRLIRRSQPGGGPGLASLLQPLIFNDLVECLVEVSTDRPEGFTPDDLKLLNSIVLAATSALRTVRLYDLQRQTAERLTELDRVKSQFLANMSHELRTPLNSIIGFSRVILKGIDGPLTDQQTQDLTSIYNSGRHLLELINDILDMSKIEAGKMEMVFEEVDLHDIIKGVMSTAVGLVKDKPAVALKEDIADPLPTVRADATRVRQVMINLMSNASKFTDKGSITLRAQPIEERDPRSNQMARYVQISVVDTGAGIAEADMHKLFTAFSQVDSSPTRKVGGTGLGLSICRSMIELHGGRIWVESKVDEGSTFAFILPLYQKEPPPPPPPDAASGAPAILVVEDDQGIVGLYRRYLEPHGYRLVGVDQSTEALPQALAQKPVAILLDVIMPNQDGWQVLADLKQNEQTRAVPVIVCTIVSDRERAMAMGAADYLTKPILEADLMQALQRLALGSAQPQPVLAASSN